MFRLYLYYELVCYWLKVLRPSLKAGLNTRGFVNFLKALIIKPQFSIILVVLPSLGLCQSTFLFEIGLSNSLVEAYLRTSLCFPSPDFSLGKVHAGAPVAALPKLVLRGDVLCIPWRLGTSSPASTNGSPHQSNNRVGLCIYVLFEPAFCDFSKKINHRSLNLDPTNIIEYGILSRRGPVCFRLRLSIQALFDFLGLARSGEKCTGTCLDAECWRIAKVRRLSWF